MTDLNLLVTLDALLSEGSVAGAARRLRLSPSAMSRALQRLRDVTGDPLLVRAGRGLVPTPRAIALRERVGTLVDATRAILSPEGHLDPGTLERRFTIRASEGFVETFGPRLLARAGEEAPRVTLRFVAKLDKDSAPLRDGRVDVETGVIDGGTAPELLAYPLFTDRWVGVVGKGHSFFGQAMDLETYGSDRHILVIRRGLQQSIDSAFSALGRERRIATIVNGFSTALSLARQMPLVATVPDRHTAGLRHGLWSFPLPFSVEDFTVSLLWHPRMEGDAGHAWLRGLVKQVCRPAIRTAGGDIATA